MHHISETPTKQLMPGVNGKYVHGTGTTFGYVSLDEGSKVPLHHHIHEQITFIVKGALEMQIGGETMLLTEGMVHVIPSNTPHSAIAKADSIVIDVFAPTRDDYRV